MGSDDSVWLTALLAAAEEEAAAIWSPVIRELHVALALSVDHAGAAELTSMGLDARRWRDRMLWVDGANEGQASNTEGRFRRGSHNASPRPLDLAADAEGVVAAARASVSAGRPVGPAHIMLGLIEAGGLGFGCAFYGLGLTESVVREAAGLPPKSRVLARGASPEPHRHPTRRGPLVLCGTGSRRRSDVLAVMIGRAAGVRSKERSDLVVTYVDAAAPYPAGRPLWCAEVADAYGVADVEAVELDGRDDAERCEIADRIRLSDLVYFSGGQPGRVYDLIWATPVMDALLDASDGGAVIGGGSAGAAVWGSWFRSDLGNRGEWEVVPMFGWLPYVVAVHHFRELGAEEEMVKARPPGVGALAVAHGGAVVVEQGWGRAIELVEGFDGTGTWWYPPDSDDAIRVGAGIDLPTV